MRISTVHLKLEVWSSASIQEADRTPKDMKKNAAVTLPAPLDNEAVAHGPTSTWKRFTDGSGEAYAENEMKRAMQSRHLTMIGERCVPKLCLHSPALCTKTFGIYAAIGGTIGTGIFLSAGSVSITLLSYERALCCKFNSFA